MTAFLLRPNQFPIRTQLCTNLIYKKIFLSTFKLKIRQKWNFTKWLPSSSLSQSSIRTLVPMQCPLSLLTNTTKTSISLKFLPVIELQKRERAKDLVIADGTSKSKNVNFIEWEFKSMLSWIEFEISSLALRWKERDNLWLLVWNRRDCFYSYA